MIEENATVVALKDQKVLVEVQRRSTCDACSAKNGCGTAVLDKVLGKKRTQFWLERDRELKVGDRLTLGLQETALIKGSLAVYFLPLLLMIVFAILGVTVAGQLALQNSDGVSIAFALIGFAAGMIWLRIFSHRASTDKRYQPIILRVDLI